MTVSSLLAVTYPHLRTFLAQAERQQLPQALLLTGPPGSGTTELTAALVSRFLEMPPTDDWTVVSAHPAVRWIGGSPVPGIAAFRDFTSALHETPYTGAWNVGVVEAIDRVSRPAAHALLKLVEEPPPSARLFFTAADSATVLPTLRSRAQLLTVPRVAPEACVSVLEGATLATPPEAAAWATQGLLGRAFAWREDPAAYHQLVTLVHRWRDLAATSLAERARQAHAWGDESAPAALADSGLLWCATLLAIRTRETAAPSEAHAFFTACVAPTVQRWMALPLALLLRIMRLLVQLGAGTLSPFQRRLLLEEALLVTLPA